VATDRRDVIVVGGGIIGCLTAYLLSREGLPDLDLEMEPEAEPAKDTAEARPSS